MSKSRFKPLAVLATFCGLTYVCSQPVYSSKSTTSTASNLAQGKAIFRSNCANCHSDGKVGGCLGPVLAGEGKRRSRTFIESRIINEPAVIAKFESEFGPELLPHPKVKREVAKKLAEYILSLPAPKGELQVKAHKPDGRGHTIAQKLAQKPVADDIAKGKKLLYEKGCLACHSLNGYGAELAPKFDGIGARRSPEAIGDQIGRAELMLGPSAEYGERGIVMPSSDLSDSEMASIISYLSSLRRAK